MKTILILIFLTGCGISSPVPPDLHGPYMCKDVAFLGKWKNTVNNRKFYLDKDCWGTLNSCSYFFKYRPPNIDGGTSFDIKVTEGDPKCLPHGETAAGLTILDGQLILDFDGELSIWDKEADGGH